jgi:aminoglycoside phosphotransferase (APT) family kinase protein
VSPRGPDSDIADVLAVVERSLGTHEVRIERTSEGVSTEVYRVHRGTETFYLRLAEEPGDDMAPEVEVHRRLLDAGVRIPDVVHYEGLAPELGRSIAVTTEIPGESLESCTDEDLARRVVHDAGRDLARINRIATNGWGWARRDGPVWPVRGEFDSWGDWVTSGIVPDVRTLAGTVFDDATVAAIERIVEDEAQRRPEPSTLVHGDFDVTQIFHRDGAYTGIIDFGEIRGAESHYDLAHFLLHDTTIVPFTLADALRRGYTDVTALGEDAAVRIVRTGVLIGVFRLARAVSRYGQRAIAGPYVRSMSDRVRALVGEVSRPETP